jgi:hypothetical protein
MSELYVTHTHASMCDICVICNLPFDTATQTSTRMHRLAAITVTMRLVHKNTLTRTRMHRLADITHEHAPCAQEHTNKHTHA